MRRAVRIESRSRSKKDVEREIALHLELRAKEFEAGGMSPEAAREAALEAFGAVSYTHLTLPTNREV